jgi:hypothetical protein
MPRERAPERTRVLARHQAPARGGRPNLITAVATTEATAGDTAMTTPIHRQLAGRGLLPREHLADSGYPSAELIVQAARAFGITLVSPAAARQLCPGQGRRRV